MVPSNVSNLLISLTVRIPGYCPVSVSSSENPIIQGNTPDNTIINSGDAKAYICSDNPAMLLAGATAGTVYEWFLNDGPNPIAGATTHTLSTLIQGNYTVRYSNAVGCWSDLSAAIAVEQSAAITLIWVSAPQAGDGVWPNSKTYEVNASPSADSYEWTASHPSAANVTPMSNGRMALVKYATGIVEDITISVKATNGCGTSDITSTTINVKSGCTPLSSLVISPNTAQAVTQNRTAITFSASANTGTPATFHEWFVDGVSVSSGATANTYTTSSTLSTTQTHTIYCRIANCDLTSPGYKQTPTVNISVAIDPTLAPLPPAAIVTTFYGEKTCLDVHKTAGDGNGDGADNNSWAGDRLPLNVRPDDFAGSKRAFTYTSSKDHSEATGQVPV
ncbi:MAG: hypothetical protein LBT04_06815 [Prevotellaceae bacterium]|nr:hypothetical protein [Prevotellaceae bacterium]